MAGLGAGGSLRVVAAIAVPALALADYWIEFGPPYPQGVPAFTAVLALAIILVFFRLRVVRGTRRFDSLILVSFLAFAVCAIAYGLVSSTFVGERSFPDGRTERVVLGYSLQPQFEKQIQATIHKQANEPQTSVRKGDETIRDEAIEQVTTLTGNPAAPYTKSSRGVIAAVLLALWELAFAGLAVLVATLTTPVTKPKPA